MVGIYEFKCAADPTKNFEIAVHDEAFDMTEYIRTMTRTGFIVKGPDVIHTLNGSIAIEPKVQESTLPETIACENCGGIMEFVSVEDGYSCSDVGCLLHFSRLEKHV